jgi:hypothetical protein
VFEGLWDAPVTRVEVGGPYAVGRNVSLKLSYQHNCHTGAPQHVANVIASQLVARF